MSPKANLRMIYIFLVHMQREIRCVTPTGTYCPIISTTGFSLLGSDSTSVATRIPTLSVQVHSMPNMSRRQAAQSGRFVKGEKPTERKWLRGLLKLGKGFAKTPLGDGASRGSILFRCRGVDGRRGCAIYGDTYIYSAVSCRHTIMGK